MAETELDPLGELDMGSIPIPCLDQFTRNLRLGRTVSLYDDETSDQLNAFRQASIHDQLTYIASQVTKSFADSVEVLTEKNLVPSEIHNAEMMHQMRRPVPDVDAAARRAIRDIRGHVLICDLVEIIGHAGDGFQAVVRLIRSHELKLTRRERISYETYVTRSNQDA